MPTLTVATYNINHSRRAVHGYAAFSWAARWKDVVSQIHMLQADCLLLQEIPCDALADLEEHFKGVSYAWFHKNEPERGGNFTSMAIGVKKGDGSVEVFPTAPGLSVFWKAKGLVVSTQHFPMRLEERMQHVEQLAEVLTTKRTDDPWIIGGDFNSFPDGSGDKQMLALNAKLGTYSASEFAVSKTSGQLALKSFRPYPYDFVPPEALEMPGKLDHVLARGIVATGAVVHDEARPNHNWTPSDHYPVVVNFQQ